jgi:hypothetical protein
MRTHVSLMLALLLAGGTLVGCSGKREPPPPPPKQDLPIDPETKKPIS